MDGIVGGTTSSKDDATWSVTFSDNTNGGTVSGIATCNTTTGTPANASPQYNDVFVQGSATGGNCWCRMTYPIRSAWVLAYTVEASDSCLYGCAVSCANGVRGNPTMRSAMFNSAGN